MDKQAPTMATAPRQHADAHVTWDEATIALHDAERGTRMKIEEPKTPYHYAGEGEASPAAKSDGLAWGELHAKLAHVETTQQQQQQESRSEWDSSDSEGAPSPFAARDAEGKKLQKDPKFADKRKSHYDEFQAVKMWRLSHPDDDEDEDDEEGEQKKDSKKADH